MNLEEFVREAAASKGTSILHSILIRKFEWLFHTTYRDRLHSICASELLPHNPGCRAPDYVHEAYGDAAEKLLCFSPKMGGMIVSGQLDDVCNQVTLALHRSNFPKFVVIDWSFPDMLAGIPWRIENTNTFPEAAEIVLDHHAENNTICFYESVPATALRIFQNADETDPSKWPTLRTEQNRPHS